MQHFFFLSLWKHPINSWKPSSRHRASTTTPPVALHSCVGKTMSAPVFFQIKETLGNMIKLTNRKKSSQEISHGESLHSGTPIWTPPQISLNPKNQLQFNHKITSNFLRESILRINFTFSTPSPPRCTVSHPATASKLQQQYDYRSLVHAAAVWERSGPRGGWRSMDPRSIPVHNVGDSVPLAARWKTKFNKRITLQRW